MSSRGGSSYPRDRYYQLLKMCQKPLPQFMETYPNFLDAMVKMGYQIGDGIKLIDQKAEVKVRLDNLKIVKCGTYQVEMPIEEYLKRQLNRYGNTIIGVKMFKQNGVDGIKKMFGREDIIISKQIDMNIDDDAKKNCKYYYLVEVKKNDS